MKVSGKTVNLSNMYGDTTDKMQEGISQFMNAVDGGYFTPAQVQGLMVTLNVDLYQLMNFLVPYATKYATPPISNFQVGAVAHGLSGAIYFGANIEFYNEALSFTVHAEQASIAHAISYGETGIDCLAISAAPCGYCRQFLYEITNCSSTPDITILINKEQYLLSALLPQAFGPQDLSVTTRLMLPQNNNIQLIPPPADQFIENALIAANKSYSPYTFDYSGVCLVTTNGCYVGAYAENAAYNPSMSPLEAAVVQLIMSGDSYANINRAILVEAQTNKISQLTATTDVLSAIAESVKLEYYQAT
jgi:cytidine deaminase